MFSSGTTSTNLKPIILPSRHVLRNHLKAILQSAGMTTAAR
jgi:hypothetical protein